MAAPFQAVLFRLGVLDFSLFVVLSVLVPITVMLFMISDSDGYCFRPAAVEIWTRYRRGPFISPNVYLSR